MTDPCRQEDTLSLMHQEMRDYQKHSMEILRTLAQQGERMIGMDDRIKKIDAALNILFERVRLLEIAPAETYSKGFFLIFSAGVGIAASVVSGVVVYAVTKG